MDYVKHYNKLIERAQGRAISGYKEKHHVIPKCMGGTDSILNLVELTPEEHFLAHQLLVKIHPNNRSIICALSRMICVSEKHKGNRSACKMYGWIRRAIKSGLSSENNPSAKFTNSQVLEIYQSDESLDVLANIYKCSRYNIISIKRKIYYRDVTENIQELPGFPQHQKSTAFPIPIDLIPDIFYDTGDYAYFFKKYRASPAVVKSIKSKKSFKRITEKLDVPGQVKRYGMTQQMVDDVYNATGANRDIAARFGIHYNTVRNIKSKYSRAFNMWEEF